MVDPLEFTVRWPVRGYELDSRGHVNNVVYLSWAEEVATAHGDDERVREDTMRRSVPIFYEVVAELCKHRP